MRILDGFRPSENEENYLLHYKMKKNDIYMLVGGNTISYLEENIKEILGCYYLYTVKRNLAPAEGSIADFVGKLF